MKNETDALNEAIIVLQQKRAKELQLLKEQLHTTYESLKPINLIKNTFQQVSSSREIKGVILGNVLGLGAAFLSKSLLAGSSHNPLKKLFGSLIQFAVAGAVSKHTEGITSTVENLFKRFVKHKKESKNEFHNNGNDLFI